MTNKRIVKDLKAIADFFISESQGAVPVALEEAIKIIERQPCEDCVSRQEFEKRIKPYDTDDKMDKALYNFAHNILISCTSVKPQRPKGRWIEQTDKNKKLYGWFYCSDVAQSLGKLMGLIIAVSAVQKWRGEKC